jgi:hypothetical protein
MLKFNEKGLLVPDQAIPVKLTDFYQAFVQVRPDEGREAIFQNFLQFCSQFLF